jgi:hypothetical protein
MYRRYAAQLLIVFALVCVILPSSTQAIGVTTIVPCSGAVADGSGGQPCTVCSLATLAQNLLNDGIFVAVFLSAILFAWAGWKYITAGGASGQINEAKSIFWNVTLGMVLILSAWIIVSVIVKTLAPSLNWNQLCGTSLSAPPAGASIG